MKVLIIEDESAAARRLTKLLHELDSEIVILETLESVSTAIAWFKTHGNPDLVMMDIHLADGSCFEIFKSADVTCPVIFTTAYDQYAIQAFKVNSIDYLLKPVKAEELQQSFKKLKNLKTTDNQLDIKMLIEQVMNKSVQYQQRFSVKSGPYIRALEVQNIALFYAEDKVVFIYTNDNQRYALDISLDKLLDQLDPVHFFRISRSLIINYSAINQMSSYLKGRIKIETKTNYSGEVIVSAERASEFKAWLNR